MRLADNPWGLATPGTDPRDVKDYVSIQMPPIEVPKRDREVIKSMELAGWKLLGSWDRVAYMERTRKANELPSALPKTGVY